MSEHVNIEKLASVLNNTSQQGKGNFARMLWQNQPADVQMELMPLLNEEAQLAINAASSGPG